MLQNCYDKAEKRCYAGIKSSMLKKKNVMLKHNYNKLESDYYVEE